MHGSSGSELLASLGRSIYPWIWNLDVFIWVGSLLNHCQKIGMDPELVQHRWVLGFSLGSSSSVRDYLSNSPFPAFSLSISWSDFQDAHKYTLSICFS